MTRDGPPSVAESMASLELVEYRFTYEEQCAQTRDHHNVSISAKNTPLEDVMSEDAPMADDCPRCGAAVIAMSNLKVLN